MRLCISSSYIRILLCQANILKPQLKWRGGTEVGTQPERPGKGANCPASDPHQGSTRRLTVRKHFQGNKK